MDGQRLHDWLLSYPVFPCAPVASTTSRGTAPYDMPAVVREHFAVVLTHDASLPSRMLADMPHRLQPYANPGAANAVAFTSAMASLAEQQAILNEFGSKAYCSRLIDIVAFIAQNLGFEPPPMPLPEDFEEPVNVQMDNQLRIGGRAVVAFEVKTDLVFIVHEIGIDQLVDVPWLGLRDISMRHFTDALSILMKVCHAVIA
jgi:hypothetical protein